MWKESYRIGIDSIDKQHMELFRMTDELLKAVEGEKDPEVFRKAVGFLKEYVVVHFRDEEAYQASIHYAGIEEHKLQHRLFTETVLAFEKQLEESNYDLKTVKLLAGTLSSWLIYHVADSDQRIAGRKPDAAEEFTGSYLSFFADSIKTVLSKMAAMSAADIHTDRKTASGFENDIIVRIGLTGDLDGGVAVGFSREFAVGLFEAMTMKRPKELDGLVCSALSEITNITCGNAVTRLSSQGRNCGIKTPVVSTGIWKEGEEMDIMCITTPCGKFELTVYGM